MQRRRQLGGWLLALPSLGETCVVPQRGGTYSRPSSGGAELRASKLLRVQVDLAKGPTPPCLQYVIKAMWRSDGELACQERDVGRWKAGTARLR